MWCLAFDPSVYFAEIEFCLARFPLLPLKWQLKLRHFGCEYISFYFICTVYFLWQLIVRSRSHLYNAFSAILILPTGDRRMTGVFATFLSVFLWQDFGSLDLRTVFVMKMLPVNSIKIFTYPEALYNTWTSKRRKCCIAAHFPLDPLSERHWQCVVSLFGNQTNCI